MSRHHYEASKEIVTQRHEKNWPYYSLIMAAMRDGDTDNQVKLAAMWPEVWIDLQKRYDAPGGILADDPPYYGPGANWLDGKRNQELSGVADVDQE